MQEETTQENKFTVQEFYDYITKHLTPEEALLKLLASSVLSYEHLKFNNDTTPVHPELIIAIAACELGWQIAVDKENETVQGLTVGTKEYMDKIFPPKTE